MLQSQSKIIKLASFNRLIYMVSFLDEFGYSELLPIPFQYASEAYH